MAIILSGEASVSGDDTGCATHALGRLKSGTFTRGYSAHEKFIVVGSDPFNFGENALHRLSWEVSEFCRSIKSFVLDLRATTGLKPEHAVAKSRDATGG